MGRTNFSPILRLDSKVIFAASQGVMTALTLEDIYGHNKNVTKSKAYLALRGADGSVSILTSWDKKEHGRKRRVIAQGFTEAAVRGYEPIVKENIQTLCTQLLGMSKESNPIVQSSEPWSAPRDMANWSKPTLHCKFRIVGDVNLFDIGSYFSFDIMTDVTFSQRKSLMTRPDNR